VLHEAETLRGIDLANMQHKDNEILHEYNKAIDVVRAWWFIELGHPLVLIRTPAGHTWACLNNRDYAMNFKWLSNKAIRYERYVKEHVNRTIKEWKREHITD